MVRFHFYLYYGVDQSFSLIFSSADSYISSTFSIQNNTSTTVFYIFLGASPSPSFVPRNCSNSSYIESSCNISMTPCDALKLCEHSGNCTNDPKFPFGYHCTCAPEFNGTNCEFKIGPCKSNTCLNDGMLFTLDISRSHRIHILIYFKYLHSIERCELLL